MNYPLAPDGIFKTVQGEGALAGELMVFIRLGGCSIGCSECDTNYKVTTKATAREIAWKAVELAVGTDWIWITGGEPTDHDLIPLIKELRRVDLKIALATAGHKELDVAVDWVSISPHDPMKWKVKKGQELKLIPKLNGYSLEDFESCLPVCFGHLFVSPCDGKNETVGECMKWIEGHRGWRMTGQLHKLWRIP